MRNRVLATVVKLDRFLLLLIIVVVLASEWPARGRFALLAADFSDAAIVLLFFIHGAKLSREAIFSGVAAWRVHLIVLACTFGLFPLLGLAAKSVADLWLNPQIGAGLVFLCLVPSTIQSSIAFTSMARGNVPAAVCSASASSVIGVVLTPLMVAWLMSAGQTDSGVSVHGISSIALKLLLPFLLGHLSRPLLSRLLDRHKAAVTTIDRGAILSVVYVAFSVAVVQGLWTRYSAADLVMASLICSLILAIALVATTSLSRLLGFSKEDEITIVFCGSKKSLASGVPIASAVFPVAMVGPLILPLMLFHQIQLMACAVIAQKYAKRPLVQSC